MRNAIIKIATMTAGITAIAALGTVDALDALTAFTILWKRSNER